MKAQVWLCVLAAAVCTRCGPEVSVRDVGASNVAAQSAPPAPGVQAPAAEVTTATSPVAAGTPGTRGSDAAAPLELTAVLYSELDAEIGARMSGIVRALNAELGDRVREGQVLALLDDARQVARVASATAARDLARAEFERADSLLGRGFVTTAQHDETRYRLRAAEASLREAEIELEHTQVRAPFDGVITRRMTGIGRAVGDAEPLFRVTALRPLRALLRVPEHDARSIRTGATVLLRASGGAQIAAIVSRVSPAVDPTSGTVEVLLDVGSPGPLRPGSSAAVQLVRAEQR